MPWHQVNFKTESLKCYLFEAFMLSMPVNETQNILIWETDIEAIYLWHSMLLYEQNGKILVPSEEMSAPKISRKVNRNSTLDYF